MSTMCSIIIDAIEICYFKYSVVVECFITVVSSNWLALLVLIKKVYVYIYWLALLVRLIWIRSWNEKVNWKKQIKLDVFGCVVY